MLPLERDILQMHMAGDTNKSFKCMKNCAAAGFGS
jgi:hypothetical protein